MISHQVIVLGIVLSLLPPDARTFSVTDPDKQVRRYTRQPMDSWQSVPPPKTAERYRLDGTALVIETQDGELPIDLSTLFGLGRDTDWQALERLAFGNTAVTIERRDDGVDLLIDSQQQAGGVRRAVYKARWIAGG